MYWVVKWEEVRELAWWRFNAAWTWDLRGSLGELRVLVGVEDAESFEVGEGFEVVKSFARF